jgi:hypothetical protein
LKVGNNRVVLGLEEGGAQDHYRQDGGERLYLKRVGFHDCKIAVDELFLFKFQEQR